MSRRRALRRQFSGRHDVTPGGSALAASDQQAGQFVAFDPSELAVMHHRQVFAQDQLRLVIDGDEGTRRAGVDGDVDQSASQNATDVFEEHNRSVIVVIVNSKQFKKWLASQGATFAPGKGGHLKVTLNGKRSVLPMGSGELKKGTQEGIKKQLGLKE